MTYEELQAENTALKEEVQTLRIENAQLRSRLGMASSDE
jgi:cell division protein FtsB